MTNTVDQEEDELEGLFSNDELENLDERGWRRLRGEELRQSIRKLFADAGASRRARPVRASRPRPRARAPRTQRASAAAAAAQPASEASGSTPPPSDADGAAAPAPAPTRSPRTEAVLARLREAAKAPTDEQPEETRLRTVRELFPLRIRFIPLVGKVPRPGATGWNRADYDHTLEQAERWAREGNVGIVCGRLIVLDIDELTPEVEALLDTLPNTLRATTGKGSHLYFLMPPGATHGNATGALPKGIDVRGAGGYVVAPGSIHPTGKPYVWADGRGPWDIGMAPLPEQVVALIKAPKAKARQAARPDGLARPMAPEIARRKEAALTAEQRERARRIVLGGLRAKPERVRHAPEGTSQDTYYEAVCDLFNHHAGELVTDDEAEALLDALDEAAEERGVEGIEATRESGIRMGSSKPRYAHEVIAEKEAEDAEAARKIERLFGRADDGDVPSTAEVEAERERLLDEAEHSIQVALNEAVQAGNPEPLHRRREEFGRLALHRPQSISAFKQCLKPHKDDLRGYLLGDFDAFVKDAKRDAAEQEADAEVERRRALDERTLIHLNGDQLALVEASKDALRVLNERSDLPTIYMRSGAPVMVTPSGKIVSVGLGELGFLLSEAAMFYRKTPEGRIAFDAPPTHLLRNLHAALPFSGDFPKLEDVRRVPTMTPSGHIIHNGYDAETGTLVVTDLEVQVGETQQDARAAVEFVAEHIFGTGARSGFPFESEADRANALGMLMTVPLRSVFGGLVPFFGVMAPSQSNGKTTLAKIPQAVVAGTSETKALPSDDRLLERDILAPAFNEATPMVVFDNVASEVNSPVLAKVGTDEEFSFRKYHEQRDVRGRNRLVVALTGNNLRLGTDFKRRTVPIRLNAKCVNPDARTGFRHPDLLEWVRRNRSEVLSALMTIARAWYVAGKPEATVPTLGSYGEWSRIIGGMLEHAGVRGFLGNLHMSQSSDQRTTEVEALLTFIAEQQGGRPFTSRDIIERHPDIVDGLGSFFKPNDLSNKATITKRFGEVLHQVSGRRYGSDESSLWVEPALDEQGQRRKDARNTGLWIIRHEEV